MEPREEIQAAERVEAAPADGAENAEEVAAVYMAVFKLAHQESLGVCLYDTLQETLHVARINDVAGLGTLKQKARPKAIVTCSRVGERLYEQLAENELEPATPFSVTTLKGHEFSLEAAHNRLRLLRVDELDGAGPLSPDEHYLRLRSLINVDDNQVVQSMGGLLAYMLKHRVVNQLEDPSAPVRIRSIRSLAVEDALQVDAQSVRALAVFVDEVLGNKHKEGLSVFGLLNQTKTRQGARLLRAWLTHPTRHMPTLQRRLDHVEYFARPDSDGLTSELRCHLRTLRDVHLVLRHFENMRARINDWSGLQESIQAVLSLQALCARAVRRDGPSQRLPQPPALLDEIARLGVGPLARLLEMVQATIDMDASRIASVRMCVRPGVHAELDQLKASFEGLDDFLTELASRDMREGNVPEVVERMSYAYLPQLGYFAKIPSATAAAPSPPIPGFEFQFAADGHLMFKNARARELDESLGDVQAIIEDSEAAIVRELVQRVLAQAGALRACAAKLHELDVLLSLAAVAAERGFARPELGSAQLRIVEGRHPLQEFCADRFIPNDTQLGGGAARIHLVTGPNNSGKSVYLKQVALVCYMAHVGSFVPARAAEVPLLEHIFTRMLNVDSVASPLSTFSNDAVQVAFALRHCSRASLVLIDEFGKGTGSFDGMALLAATCGFFEARQQASPLALVATHFHELFDARMLRESPLTEFWTMDIAQQRQHRVPQGESVGDDDDPSAEIVFLFKLKRGLAHRSFGLHCARLAGLQPQVLERAAQVASLVRSGRPVTAAFSVSREEAERRARIVDTFWRLDLERNEPDLAPLLQLLRGE